LPGRSRELRARHRVLCAWAGCFSLGFAAYISFVPFNFSTLERAQLFAAVRTALTLSVESRTNFLANIILFVPVGFFGAGALGLEARPLLGSGLRAALLVAGTLASSSAIEATQIFLPSRTAAGSDVLAQLLGGAIGMALWLHAGREVGAWLGGRSEEKARSTAVVVLQAIVGALTLSALLPLDVTFSASTLAAKLREGRIVLVPFAHHSIDARIAQELIYDALFSMPFGALALVGWNTARSRRRIIMAILMAVVAIGGIEVCQVFIMSRTADVTDVVTGAVGAVAGVLLAARLSDATPIAGEAAGRWSAWALAGLAGALVMYALTNLSPFDFAVTTGMLRERWPALLGVPFYTYYVNPEFQAFGTFVGKLAVSVPLGLFFRLAMPQGSQSFRRSQLVAAAGAIAAFFLGVEVGQIFLPSRFPDVTDVIIGLMGVGLGFRLADLTRRSSGGWRAAPGRSTSSWR
jgi:glycopeptide antibiotics resistance protein